MSTKRVVTGHNADGKSVIKWEDRGQNVTHIPSWEGLFVTELWVTG